MGASYFFLEAVFLTAVFFAAFFLAGALVAASALVSATAAVFFSFGSCLGSSGALKDCPS